MIRQRKTKRNNPLFMRNAKIQRVASFRIKFNKYGDMLIINKKRNNVTN